MNLPVSAEHYGLSLKLSVPGLVSMTKPKLIQQFPSLQPGLNLLETGRDTVFHQIAVNHLQGREGTAYWIDSRNQASTYVLNQAAPKKVLKRIHLARAFTAYQHYSLIQRLEQHVDHKTELVLLPYLTSLYRDQEVNQEETVELLRQASSTIKDLAEKHELHILISLPGTADSRIRSIILEGISKTIKAGENQLGAFFESEGFQSKVLPVNHGLLQTTWAYWKDILGENRAPEQKFLEEVTPFGTY